MTSPTTTSIKCRNKAFTLIELIIVMTIIAAMISVAAPYAKRSSKSTIVLNEALNIKELIYYAIDQSRSSNTAVRFVYSRADEAYWLESSESQEPYEFKKVDNSFGSPRSFDHSIQTVNMEGTEATKEFDYIIFDPGINLPDSISIRLETFDCWAELKIDKNNIRITNDNY